MTTVDRSQSFIRADTALRRVVDVVGAASCLVLTLPLLLMVGLAVRLGSRGPVLFRQSRVGIGGRPFTMLKFRTMVVDAQQAGPAVSGNADSRVNRVGAVLRKTKLDELPQLVNVLRGDMTLIGPRAEVARYVAHYTPSELATLTVRPGVTGPGGIWFTVTQAAELDGCADPEREYVERQLHDKLALDLVYLRNRTLSRDLKIVWETFAVIFRR